MKYDKRYLERINKWYKSYSNQDYLSRHPELERFDMPKTFYFRYFPDRLERIHWAIIVSLNDTYHSPVSVYFINNWGRVFDKLEFKSVKIARRRLRRNGFDFSTNRYCPFTPPEPIYIQLSEGKKSAPYSKGNLWQSVPRDKKHIDKIENTCIKSIVERYEYYHGATQNKTTKKQEQAKSKKSKHKTTNKKGGNFYGNHFEALGDIWDAMYGNADNFIKDYLVKSCQEGSLYWTQKINNRLIYSLLYPGAKKKNSLTRFNELLKSGDEYIQIINYIEDNKHSKTHMTACPVLKGIKNSLKLKESYTWRNGIEGEFAAESLTVNELLLNFFDPFYPFDRKHKFEEGKICDVYLSAIAYIAEELEERDDVYTEGTPYNLYLERFLKENPDKTEADFEPPVIEMRAEHFRMYVHTDTTSVQEIVGLIEDMEYIEAFGKKFAKLKVNLEHREDNEYLYVNVYVGEHLLKKYKPEIGKGIHANIHMFGYFEQTMISSNSVKGEKFGCAWIIAILLLLVLILSALGY